MDLAQISGTKRLLFCVLFLDTNRDLAGCFIMGSKFIEKEMDTNDTRCEVLAETIRESMYCKQKEAFYLSKATKCIVMREMPECDLWCPA
mmetsp:Transcript_17178/g.26799  ORF Transcript_17178/g.26799 Transcript_17178/m.26799 type:complete len:90 (-) Transcript_17178:141-410(-)